VIDTKDLPPEVLGAVAGATAPIASAPVAAATPVPPVAVAAPAADPAGTVADAPAPAPQAMAAPVAPAGEGNGSWEAGLQAVAMALLETGRTDVWDVLTRRFETRLIQTALASTRGRRIEAAHKLGIGRNTITRKIQELGLDD